MLVNAKQPLIIHLPKQVNDDATATAAAGLQSGLHGAMLQTLQNQSQLQSAQTASTVQASATQIATQQVSEATRISDNVDEAFAKTRVGLQSTDTSDATKTTGTSATDEFKDYMSKSPEQRLRDSILQSMGITEDDIKAMPPEKQLAIGKEIAERLQDKMKLAQAEKDNDVKDSDKQADKFLAAL
ncbi:MULTISPECIES: hypothetical protein [Pseudomonas]|jgi:hypothetical protein|uniref:Uncharacterized protein n=1 Tax=Pseudomonas fluorescens TaxID=294 RepID=A0A5E7L5L4_PSEFL|nr:MULTISPECIES: hypothetical protein [Pseudomonas]MCP1486651.1 hypothetical protein [Pseudomonas fluorescens]PRB49236.1 hypothetical protein CQ025_13355 [Pseudomonas sp. MYb3]PRC33689.1 hypothetical protein CQ009_13560 [Pseudomonas sp. MYb2]VVP08406.1 hypothetical protein PS896_03202 [Pseudomonas fluorescens]